MKIALVLFGQPRFVDFKLASISQKWALRSHDVSFYGHVWEESSDIASETSSWTGLGELKMPNDSIGLIKANYPNIKLVSDRVEDFNSFFHSDKMALEACKYWKKYEFDQDFYHLGTSPEAMFRNTLSQLFSIHEALNVFEKQSKNIHFDLVLLTRYDAVILGLPNLGVLQPDRLYIEKSTRQFADVLLIGGKREILSTDAFQSFSELTFLIALPSAEQYKQAAFLSNERIEKIEEIKLELFMLRGTNFKYLFRSIVIEPIRTKLRIRSRLSALFRGKTAL